MSTDPLDPFKQLCSLLPSNPPAWHRSFRHNLIPSPAQITSSRRKWPRNYLPGLLHLETLNNQQLAAFVSTKEATLITLLVPDCKRGGIPNENQISTAHAALRVVARLFDPTNKFSQLKKVPQQLLSFRAVSSLVLLNSQMLNVLEQTRSHVHVPSIASIVSSAATDSPPPPQPPPSPRRSSAEFHAEDENHSDVSSEDDNKSSSSDEMRLLADLPVPESEIVEILVLSMELAARAAQIELDDDDDNDDDDDDDDKEIQMKDETRKDENEIEAAFPERFEFEHQTDAFECAVKCLARFGPKLQSSKKSMKT
jgi:hypothetical protein